MNYKRSYGLLSLLAVGWLIAACGASAEPVGGFGTYSHEDHSAVITYQIPAPQNHPLLVRVEEYRAIVGAEPHSYILVTVDNRFGSETQVFHEINVVTDAGLTLPFVQASDAVSDWARIQDLSRTNKNKGFYIHNDMNDLDSVLPGAISQYLMVSHGTLDSVGRVFLIPGWDLLSMGEAIEKGASAIATLKTDLEPKELFRGTFTFREPLPTPTPMPTPTQVPPTVTPIPTSTPAPTPTPIPPEQVYVDAIIAYMDGFYGKVHPLVSQMNQYSPEFGFYGFGSIPDSVNELLEERELFSRISQPSVYDEIHMEFYWALEKYKHYANVMLAASDPNQSRSYQTERIAEAKVALVEAAALVATALVNLQRSIPQSPTPEPTPTLTPVTSPIPTAVPAPASTPEPEFLLELGRDWRCYKETFGEFGGFMYAEGQVRNISGRSLDNVQAVATFLTADGTFITSDTALIEYNPILPGQTSPFKVMANLNPLFARCTINFKEFFGTTIRFQISPTPTPQPTPIFAFGTPGASVKIRVAANGARAYLNLVDCKPITRDISYFQPYGDSVLVYDGDAAVIVEAPAKCSPPWWLLKFEKRIIMNGETYEPFELQLWVPLGYIVPR